MRTSLNEAEKLIVTSVFLHEGIVPLMPETISSDINRPLKDISAEDAHKMRRKFRKLWRKAARQNAAKGRTMPKTGFGKQGTPSKLEKYARKKLVFDVLFKDKIEKLIVSVKQISRTKAPQPSPASPSECEVDEECE